MPQRKKCEICGWFDGERFHVCLKPTPEPKPTYENQEYVEKVLGPSRTMSLENKEAISVAQKERWRSRNGDRDVKLVERYSEGGVSYNDLAAEFEISRSTVINVMKKASAAGAVVLRAPGMNIKHGG